MKAVFAAMDRTWPAVSLRQAGGWLVREGRGGGRRVSAATVADASAADTIALAEDAHQALSQPPVFCLTPGDQAIDRQLADRGYRLGDQVTLLAAPTDRLAAEGPDHLTTFPLWPPLAISVDLWADGGIGPARLAVMARAGVPRVAILGRVGDRAAGVAYAAVDGDMAMVHSVHVAPGARRRGLARNLMRAAAAWAGAQGASRLSLAVEDGNLPALGLYRALGMETVGRYHYRERD